MNAVKGTNRLVFEDAYWFYGKLILLYITVPLSALWIIVGILFDVGSASSVIHGPTFFFIPFYAAIGYKTLLPIAMGLGSTRIQLLKTFYLVAISLTVAFVFMLNVLQFILYKLYETGISSASVQHIAKYLLDDYHFLSYVSIDLGMFIFLFGVTFLISSLFSRLGMKRMVIYFMILSSILTILYYAGALDKSLASLFGLNMNPVLFFALLGVIGLLALAIAYPIIKDVSLEKKTARF